MCAIDEDDSEHEETNDSEEVLQAWCLLEECENEQRQDVVSKRQKQKMKKANPASLLSEESSHNLKTKEIIEVKDTWHPGLPSRRPCDACHNVPTCHA